MLNKTFNMPTAKLQDDRLKKQSMVGSPRATESGRNNPARVVSVSDASATEGEKEVFTVGLSNTTKSPTTVSLKLAGETATVDKDFSRKLEASFDSGKTWKSVASNGRLEVGVGVKDFQVRTQTLADNLAEGTETFKLKARNRGGSASGTGKILDATAPIVQPVAAPTPVAPKPVAAPITPAAPALSPAAKAITDKRASAIHIDIDGDGLNTTNIKNGVKFDILNNGTPINTGWGNADDSLLVLDRNGNGKIDNGSELFGGGVGEGFAKLAALDTNKDGILDAKDTDFGKLQVWNDRNQNGVTDPGELKSLKDVNIASLNLGYTNDFKTLNNGNLYGETSTAKTLNGNPAFSMVEVYYPITAAPTAPTPVAPKPVVAAPTLAAPKPVVAAPTLAAPKPVVAAPTPVAPKPVVAAPTPVAPKPVAAPITPAAPALSPEAKAITDKGASAIHIDIDGDGLNTTNIKNGVKFDILNNGTPINTGWGNADDSLLVFDRNGNGKIDNGSELFGGGVGQGFAQLAALDTNKDGILDAKDTDFSKLQVWNDRNQNGVTDPGELKSLKDVNIASLNLGYTNDFKTLNNGNLYGETSTAKTLNGDPAFSMVEVYYPIA